MWECVHVGVVGAAQGVTRPSPCSSERASNGQSQVDEARDEVRTHPGDGYESDSGMESCFLQYG